MDAPTAAESSTRAPSDEWMAAGGAAPGHDDGTPGRLMGVGSGGGPSHAGAAGFEVLGAGGAVVAVVAPPDATAPKATKPRLTHVDAMRPVKQWGVVTTHSLLAFCPAGIAAEGGALTLLHVTREMFLFISACMLVYAYPQLRRRDLGRFYRRRLVTVGLPYVTWTLVYFFVGLPGSGMGPAAAAEHLGHLMLTGYYQLYYLTVLIQFYAVYPLFLWVVRRFDDRPWRLLLGSAALQVAYTALMHWSVLPAGLRGSAATREIMSYQLYLVGGAVAAIHLHRFHTWLTAHWKAVLAALVVTAAAAEAWYAGATAGVSWLGSGSDPFQPVVIPFNLAAIAAVYLVGVLLARPGGSRRRHRLVQVGSDDSYGIYLAQMLFIDGLGTIGLGHLDHRLPWPLVVLVGVVVTFFGCILLTSLLARTPWSQALTGRPRQPWSTLSPRVWWQGRPPSGGRGAVATAGSAGAAG